MVSFVSEVFASCPVPIPLIVPEENVVRTMSASKFATQIRTARQEKFVSKELVIPGVDRILVFYHKLVNFNCV